MLSLIKILVENVTPPMSQISYEQRAVVLVSIRMERRIGCVHSGAAVAVHESGPRSPFSANFCGASGNVLMELATLPIVFAESP